MRRGVACIFILLLCGASVGCVLLPLDDLAPPKKQSLILSRDPVSVSIDRYLFSRGYGVTFASEALSPGEMISVSVSNRGKIPLHIGYGAHLSDWKTVYLQPGESVHIDSGAAGDFLRNWRWEVGSPDSGRSILQISLSPLSWPFRGGKLIISSQTSPHPFF